MADILNTVFAKKTKFTISIGKPGNTDVKFKFPISLICQKMSVKCLLILSVEMICILFLMDLPMVKLIKLAKVADEADHAYSIQSTWWLHQLATDVPFIACVINLPCIFLPMSCRIFSFIL